MAAASSVEAAVARAVAVVIRVVAGAEIRVAVGSEEVPEVVEGPVYRS